MNSMCRGYFCVVWTATLIACLTHQVHAYRNGDFIQTARKAQFHGQRTNWHDLVGEACPRFGRERLVAVTLPKPVPPPGVDITDEYKVQFGFDGDRHMTHWLKLVGKGAPTVPMVQVTLKRSGDELIGVTSKVMDAPIYLQHTDTRYVSQWRNATHWPKRLLVSYRWETHNDVDLDRGLAVLLSVGLIVGALLAVNAALGAGPKLTQFLNEIAAELGTDEAVGGGAPGGGQGPRPAVPVWKGGGKGE